MDVKTTMANTIFSKVKGDLIELEGLTEEKIGAVIRRDAPYLVELLQKQIDPMNRLQTHTLELSLLSDAEKQDLKSHIVLWNNREKYLSDLIEKNLGYISYLKSLLGIGPERTGLSIDL